MNDIFLDNLLFEGSCSSLISPSGESCPHGFWVLSDTPNPQPGGRGISIPSSISWVSLPRVKVSNPFLTLSLSESVVETFKVVLTPESVDEILWCDHSNETPSAVLPHGTISIQVFYERNLRSALNFDFRHSWE